MTLAIAADVGCFAVVAGNDQPTVITAATVTGGPYPTSGTTTAITLNEANKYATSAGAVLTVYESCKVAAGSNYLAGWVPGYSRHRLDQRAVHRPVGGLRHRQRPGDLHGDRVRLQRQQHPDASSWIGRWTPR